MGEFSALEAQAKEIARHIQSLEDIGLVYNFDADGISGGGIIGTALRREGKPFNALALKQLYQEELEKIKALGKNIIFVDFGSGQYDWLQEQFGESFVVIDHHQPQNNSLDRHFNPILFGYDAGHEVSAAGAAYFVAKAMNPRNADLAALAIVGAAGDIQDFEGSFEGLNLQILKEAQDCGALLVENDLRLYGRISRPLTQFLAYATNPVLPELTGNEENCRAFLEELGIPLHDGMKWITYNMLSKEEKKRLTTALLLHLQSHETPEWKLRELIGPTYAIAKEPLDSPLRDAKEYGTILNACVMPGTEIYLNGMPTEIEKINSKAIFSVENGKIVRDAIEKTHQIPLPENMNVLEVTTKTGRKVTVTENHEFLSLMDGNPTWVSADKLAEGGYVAISKSVPESSFPLDFWGFFSREEFRQEGEKVRFPKSFKALKVPIFNFDLGFVIGYVAGDGHINKYSVDIAFSRKPRDMNSLEKIKKVFREQFGIEKQTISNKENYFNSAWGGALLSAFFQRVGIPSGKKSTTVSFDARILEGEKPFVAGILRGLFSSDGNIYSGGIEFSSHSVKLVNQMVYLLQRFSILAHLSERKCKDCDGKKYRLLVCGKTNILKFVEQIGFPHEETNKKLIEMTKKMNPINSRELYLPIREKLLLLRKLLGVPNKWSAHFTYYKGGKQPSIENVQKYIEHYKQRIKLCEDAISRQDIQKTIQSFNTSRLAFSKVGGISDTWLFRILKGKKPGKNASKKLDKAFGHYKQIIPEAKKAILEITQFLETDLYWDKIKHILPVTENKPRFVYDITVEKNHNYIANGIIVHNCGRHGKSEVGLQLVMGDRGAYYDQALQLLQQHRRLLRDGIEFMQSKGVEEREQYYLFDAGQRIGETIIGIVAGMHYSTFFEATKPIVALSHNENGTVKASARATKELVLNGINLGIALREIAEQLGKGAQGGGHHIAGGIQIRYDQQEAFLRLLDEALRKQKEQNIKPFERP